MKAQIHVTLKDGVLDPQGKAIETALDHLGYGSVGNVRQGKFFELELDAKNREKAETMLEEMCSKLLANTVIENYSYEILDA